MNSLMYSYFAALVFGFFTVLVCLFQLALAAGVPWGDVAMAGKYPGRWPPAMRLVAIVQIFVLLFLAAVVWIRAGIIFPQWFHTSETLIWGAVVFGVLGLILNLITPIKWERIIWAPVTAILLICSIIVAVN